MFPTYCIEVKYKRWFTPESKTQIKDLVRKRIWLELTRSISGGDIDVVAQNEIETVEVSSCCSQMKPGLKHKKQTEDEPNGKHAAQ